MFFSLYHCTYPMVSISNYYDAQSIHGKLIPFCRKMTTYLTNIKELLSKNLHYTQGLLIELLGTRDHTISASKSIVLNHLIIIQQCKRKNKGTLPFRQIVVIDNNLVVLYLLYFQNIVLKFVLHQPKHWHSSHHHQSTMRHKTICKVEIVLHPIATFTMFTTTLYNFLS